MIYWQELELNFRFFHKIEEKKKKKSFRCVITDEGSHTALNIYSFYQVMISHLQLLIGCLIILTGG